MKRILVLALLLFICVNGAGYAKEMQSFDCAGISFEVPINWICETPSDGASMFYDMETGRILSVCVEKTDGFLFDFGFEMAVPYMESIFQGDNLWSYVGLISKDGINGCYAAGYIENMPAGFAYLEKGNNMATFVFADAMGVQNPNYLLAEMLDCFPWLNDDGVLDFQAAEMIDFTIGGYEYRVPENWRHSEAVDYIERSHTYNDEDILLSIHWENREEANMQSAVDMLYRVFPHSQVELINGEKKGFLMDGECVTGTEMIKSCLLASPGYLEITYIHYGVDSETQRKEFDEWFETFQEIQ